MYESKGLKRSLALIVAKNLPAVRQKGGGDEFDPGQCLKLSRKTLICMPFQYRDFEASLPFFKKLVSLSGENKVTAATPESFRNWLERSQLKAVVSLKPDDANILNLPGKGLRNSLNRQQFNLAIDLNFDDNLFSSILCAVSGAKVRIGFASESCGGFFNYLIAPRESSDSQAKYRIMMRYLCNS